MSGQDNSSPSSPDLIDVLRQLEEHLAALRRERDKTPGDWLTVEEAAKGLKLSRDTIERLIGSGQLKAAAIETPKGRGRRSRYRIRQEWIDDYMLSKAERASAPEPQRHRRRRPQAPHDFIG